MSGYETTTQRNATQRNTTPPAPPSTTMRRFVSGSPSTLGRGRRGFTPEHQPAPCPDTFPLRSVHPSALCCLGRRRRCARERRAPSCSLCDPPHVHGGFFCPVKSSITFPFLPCLTLCGFEGMGGGGVEVGGGGSAEACCDTGRPGATQPRKLQSGNPQIP